MLSDKLRDFVSRISLPLSKKVLLWGNTNFLSLQHVKKKNNIQPVLNSCVMKEGQNHLNFNAALYTLLLLTVPAAK